MHEPLSAEKTAELQKEFPVDEAPTKLTKREKLLRLADIVEKYRGSVYVFDRIEQRNDNNLKQYWHPLSVFSIAVAQDDVFRKDGLRVTDVPGYPGQVTVYDGRTYFEMTGDELHAISCNCGGELRANDMASRLRTMANGGHIAQFIRGTFAW